MNHQILRKTEYPQQDIRRNGKYFVQIINDTMETKGINAGDKHFVASQIIHPVIVYRQVGFAIANMLQKVRTIDITQPGRQCGNQQDINEIPARRRSA